MLRASARNSPKQLRNPIYITLRPGMSIYEWNIIYLHRLCIVALHSTSKCKWMLNRVDLCVASECSKQLRNSIYITLRRGMSIFEWKMIYIHRTCIVALYLTSKCKWLLNRVDLGIASECSKFEIRFI